MKEIEAEKQIVPWWVGRRAICSVCGRVVELEAGDEKLTHWYSACEGASVQFRCECCGNTVMLRKG